MKTKTQKVRDELRPEYDFDYSKAVRGKYHKRLSGEGSNIVVLEPDVAKAFSTSTAVNETPGFTDATPNKSSQWTPKRAPLSATLAFYH